MLRNGSTLFVARGTVGESVEQSKHETPGTEAYVSVGPAVLVRAKTECDALKCLTNSSAPMDANLPWTDRLQCSRHVSFPPPQPLCTAEFLPSKSRAPLAPPGPPVRGPTPPKTRKPQDYFATSQLSHGIWEEVLEDGSTESGTVRLRAAKKALKKLIADQSAAKARRALEKKKRRQAKDIERRKRKYLAEKKARMVALAEKKKANLQNKKETLARRRQELRDRKTQVSSSGPARAWNLFVQNETRGTTNLDLAAMGRKWKNMTKVQKKPFEVEARKNLMKRTVIKESLKQPPNAYALFTKEHFTRLYQIELKKGGAKKDAFAAATRECSKLFRAKT